MSSTRVGMLGWQRGKVLTVEMSCRYSIGSNSNFHFVGGQCLALCVIETFSILDDAKGDCCGRMEWKGDVRVGKSGWSGLGFGGLLLSWLTYCPGSDSSLLKAGRH